MAERVDDLVEAIREDHAQLGARRRQREAATDAGKVRAAAMLQVHDIVETFLNRMRRR